MPDFESLKQRIELLERKQERILNDIHDERAEISSESEQPVRLAYTTTSGTYPPDPSTAFELNFVDAYHAEFAGTPSFATVDHSATSQRVGYSITGKHIPENTLVAVFRQNSKYWILPYFPETTPTPGGDSKPVAIYRTPKTFFTTGPDVGDEDTAYPTFFLIDSTYNRANKKMANWLFSDGDIAEIGITQSGTGFVFANTGIYEVAMNARIEPIRLDTPGYTTDSLEYHFTLQVSGTFVSDWNGTLIASYVANNQNWDADNDGTGFAGPGGTYVTNYRRTIVGHLFFEVTAPTSVSIEGVAGSLDASLTDYGFRINQANTSLKFTKIA